jgi:hypothetical protein
MIRELCLETWQALRHHPDPHCFAVLGFLGLYFHDAFPQGASRKKKKRIASFEAF